MPPPSSTATDAQALMTALCPALASGKLQAALDVVRQHWTPDQLITLLNHAEADIRKLSALALGYIGDRSAIVPLAVALHDSDELVNQMAEHAMWAIWFRLGKPGAICLVKVGSCDLSAGRYECAIEKLTRAIHTDSDFAEAHNQRAIGYYLMERYEESIADCQATLQRMPQHFGAMAGMGHCHANLGQWEAARRCYRLALAINPRLEGIESSLHQVEKILAESGNA